VATARRTTRRGTGTARTRLTIGSRWSEPLSRSRRYDDHGPHRSQREEQPQDKLADAELQFIGGELDGLKLLGFGIWQQRNGSGRNVTFPARPFMVNGERRNFALIRAVDDRSAEDRLRQLVLQAYAEEAERETNVAS
jgi:hypothetical protein